MDNVVFDKYTDENDGCARKFRTGIGPVLLDLNAGGRINITVDKNVTQPHGVIRTAATSGPSFEAVRNATVTRILDRLIVSVLVGGGQRTVVQGGTVMITGGADVNMNISGNRVYLNGQDVTAQVQEPQAEVEMDIVLPLGSRVDLDIPAAQVRILGDALESLKIRAASGSVAVGEVGDLEVRASSGNFTVGKVTGALHARLSSGNLSVAAYAGHVGRVALASGSAVVHAVPQSRGSFDTSISSGSVVLTGSGHLNTSRRRCSSGVLNIS